MGSSDIPIIVQNVTFSVVNAAAAAGADCQQQLEAHNLVN